MIIIGHDAELLPYAELLLHSERSETAYENKTLNKKPSQ
jgi:hypothetical protein